MKSSYHISSGKIIRKSPDFSQLSKERPFKGLLERKDRTGGRSRGRITTRHRGGGAKKKFRIIDFRFTDKLNIPGRVESIEYDPNRSAFIALIIYKDGERRYSVAHQGMKVGDTVITAENTPLNPGNRLQIKNIPSGYFIYNVELNPGGGAKMVRSAGNFAQVLSQEDNYTIIQLPSKESRKILNSCYVTIGQVSNIDHNKTVLGKAGASRRRGRRPTVRGTAMNAVDHPHGGGEGKTPIGLKYPKTPWGKPAKFWRTRKARTWDKLILKRRYQQK